MIKWKKRMAKITCEELMQWQRDKKFTLLDVRLSGVKEAQPGSISNAEWRDPEHIATWLPSISTYQPVIVFCAHGRSVSQGLAVQLEQAGLETYVLEGGLAAWIEQGGIIISQT
jgi:rhodanese-related sulfurtransferase